MQYSRAYVGMNLNVSRAYSQPLHALALLHVVVQLVCMCTNIRFDATTVVVLSCYKQLNTNTQHSTLQAVGTELTAATRVSAPSCTCSDGPSLPLSLHDMVVLSSIWS